MSDPLLAVGDGHTPLDDDAIEGLKPPWIATRGDLNIAEQANIVKAMRNRRPTAAVLLTQSYLRDLHRAMFGDVWSWAGTYRTSDPIIGCPWKLITENVGTLLGDAAHWIEISTYPLEEVAIRFHHRLVATHPFPNGNGRHSRLAAGYLASALGARVPTWGASLGLATPELRRRYIGALVLADRENDLSALTTFALS